MTELTKTLTENPNYIILLFLGVLLLFLVLFITIKVVTHHKKKKMRSQKDTAELIFDTTALSSSRFVTTAQFTGYKVYSINQNEPKIIGKSIFVPVGVCELDMEYINSDYYTKRRSVTTTYGRQVFKIEVENDKRYLISFDTKEKNFVVSEK